MTLFSVKGFEAVSVAEIAEAVGIKAPSLYKHFKSKQDIFGAIIEEMEARYERQMSGMQLDGRRAERDKDVYANVDVDDLIDIGRNFFLHYLHDEYARKFRKILTLEQYSNRALADIYVKRYFDTQIDYIEKSFDLLVSIGRLIPEDTRIMALNYYSPSYLLTNMCDAHPEMEEEALKMNEQHIRQFVRVYGDYSNENEKN